MNAFDRKLAATDDYPLRSEGISTLQVNIGYRCNLRCVHCHVEASPDRKEEMSLATIDKVVTILKDRSEITTLDITGGAPELNPHFRHLVLDTVHCGKKVIVRSNLAIYTEKDMQDVPAFLAENRVKIIASLPCYTEEGVDSQRGKGTYRKVIPALKHLNELGYGEPDSGLEIDIMFNPANADVAPDQQMLEKTFKEKLKEMHGVRFSHLITLSNMPIGRFGKSMSAEKKKNYLAHLEDKYNSQTIKNLMCKELISVSPDGNIYDCDFWQMLKLPVKIRNSNDIKSFDHNALSNREIMTASWCFMCTAGAGASCGGALA